MKEDLHKGFFSLMLCLFATMLILPLPDQARYIPALFQAFISARFLLSLYVLAKGKHELIIGLVLAVPAVAFSWISIYFPTQLFIALGTALGVLFYIYLTGVIARSIFITDSVSRNTIYGAVSIYLLIGFIWTDIYFLTYLFVPNSFSAFPPVALSSLSLIANYETLLYVSFATITSLGYGDYIPLTSVAQFFAMLEAILGHLFLATAIARIVTLSVRRGFLR